MTSDEKPELTKVRYGPFHRLKSTTQTLEHALEQRRSGELWGRTPRGSAWPQVKAYRRPLPPATDGIEFYTYTRPDDDTTHFDVRWSVPPWGTAVRAGDELAIIDCEVTRIFYGSDR